MGRQAGAEELRHTECSPAMTVAGVLELERWKEEAPESIAGGGDPLKPGMADVVAAIWSVMEESRRNRSGIAEDQLCSRLSVRR